MRIALISLLLVTVAACPRKEAPATARPAAALPADPEIALEAMAVECDGMLSALAQFRRCPNHEDEERELLDAWIERANRDFTAAKKAEPEPGAQQAIAGACRKASDSLRAATERCQAGPRPPGEFERD